jgi:hypothetical protein
VEQERIKINQALHSSLPADAPKWLQPCHLEFYGAFHREWSKFDHCQENEKAISYWYHKTLEKSTWDSPTLILTSLLQHGIESDLANSVRDWDTHGDDFIKVILQPANSRKKRDRHYLYINRNS